MELLDLSNLRPSPGARRPRKRIGRGPGSGTGKTSGRGHKGKGSRSGGNVAPGYEGGQMPLQRRLPKRGFKPVSRRTYTIVKLSQLDRFDAGTEIDGKVLAEAGLARLGAPVKLLADGTLSKSLSIKVERASEAAQKAVRDAGGSIEVLVPAKPKTKPKMPAASPESKDDQAKTTKSKDAKSKEAKSKEPKSKDAKPKDAKSKDAKSKDAKSKKDTAPKADAAPDAEPPAEDSGAES